MIKEFLDMVFGKKYSAFALIIYGFGFSAMKDGNILPATLFFTLFVASVIYTEYFEEGIKDDYDMELPNPKPMIYLSEKDYGDD